MAVTEIERDAGVALKTLRAGLVREFDIDVSLGTVSKAIKSLHITWKNVLPIPESWNTPKTIAERTEYAERATMEYASDREFIYIDEQGYDLHLSRKTKGHALSGQPAVLAMKPKGPRVSLIAALSKQGIIHTKLVESLGPQKRGTNADDFRLFIHDLRAKISRGALLLFDGAKIHVAEELKELWPVLETEFAIEHVVLPANSSFLNAIEYAFNKIKIGVQASNPPDTRTLKHNIIEVTKTISASDAEGFMHKARSYWGMARRGLPFTGKILDPVLLEGPHGAATSAHSSVAASSAAAAAGMHA